MEINHMIHNKVNEIDTNKKNTKNQRNRTGSLKIHLKKNKGSASLVKQRKGAESFNKITI